ncbi:MAG: M61 family metallopeptidase [Acidobacteria bacterium]|nr:M61 family metallopeptidase [Acidobacteriota bacterium]
MLLFLCLAAPAQEPIRYTVRFPRPHTHYLEVAASVPAGRPSVELFMAVWTPGSYLVREYSRNVEDFQARTPEGRPLAWTKTRKNRWRIESGGAPRIEVSYRVYARELSVQGNWVDAEFAMLNGAPNFVTLAGAEKRPYEVKLELPPAWRKSISGMHSGGAPHTYVAADFDELLDCPIYAGNAPIHEFEVDGKKHHLVNEGEGPMWDGPASARDAARIVAEYNRQWGGLPYDRYVFFNLLLESGGGLEHKNSTWLGASRWAYGNTQDPPESAPGSGEARSRTPNRLSWLGLVSHEYFHVWNVKRLRPAELGPFDYENEVYTRSLWLAEGVTSYYGPLALRRAGLSARDQYLRSLSGTIAQLQTAPGRLAAPVESLSYDAWIKLYRPNENSTNTGISYYTKGAVIGFLLDAKIRKASNGARSLDDVMKDAFARYGGARGYTPGEFRALAGAEFGPWFRKALETTEELDYSEALDWYGLRFKTEPQRPGAAPRILTGIATSAASGRIRVTGLRRGTPGYDSGLNVDDEILAVDGYRVRPEQWPARLAGYKPGETVEVLVARRDRLMNIALAIVADQPASWSLEVRPDATEEQKAHRKAWLREE